jgi:xanthine dehydrogenase accessory factor
MMNIWEAALKLLNKGKPVVLLYVLESNGSSPGRKGFKMIVDSTGVMCGSVGGGIMEHKLVELSKSLLEEGPFEPFNRLQIHTSEAEKNRSGMICSGDQTLAFYYLGAKDTVLIDKILNAAEEELLELTETGLQLVTDAGQKEQFRLSVLHENSWLLTEKLIFNNTAYIFGGGHVGLAMSEMMKFLGFRVVVLDDRKYLNTMQQNRFADELLVIDYEESEKYIPEGEQSYVILMSFGYKTDEVIIKRLLGKNYKYLGMMGSQHKIDTMWKKLLNEGYNDKDIQKVFAPIGIPIKNDTPEEIAVSIAAQIIDVKNKK